VYKASVGWRSIQARFEETVVGRIVISAFLIVTLLAVLTANLPASRLQTLLLDAGHYYIYGTGLDESWGVFSPDPRRETVHVTATVTYADGSKATWVVRRRDPVLGAYVDYRWLKWAEYAVSPGDRQLWHPFAVFAARRLATPTHRPTRVAISNRWYDLQPPGVGQPRFVQQQTFYTTRITEANLHGAGS
jgi:hypothetical protein